MGGSSVIFSNLYSLQLELRMRHEMPERYGKPQGNVDAHGGAFSQLGGGTKVPFGGGVFLRVKRSYRLTYARLLPAPWTSLIGVPSSASTAYVLRDTPMASHTLAFAPATNPLLMDNVALDRRSQSRGSAPHPCAAVPSRQHVPPPVLASKRSWRIDCGSSEPSAKAEDMATIAFLDTTSSKCSRLSLVSRVGWMM
eukprot:scaffold49665_cov36-Tisochrysis_lutea.AAC.2